MQNKVNVQRSKLLADGMLHIEMLDGSSYLYSLQELADIIAAQPRVQADGACPECKGNAGYHKTGCKLWLWEPSPQRE